MADVRTGVTSLFLPTKNFLVGVERFFFVENRIDMNIRPINVSREWKKAVL